MAQIKITVRKNGPYRVEAPEGSIELVDGDGKAYNLTGKTAFSLCRCGGSVSSHFVMARIPRTVFRRPKLPYKPNSNSKNLEGFLSCTALAQSSDREIGPTHAAGFLTHYCWLVWPAAGFSFIACLSCFGAMFFASFR